METRSGHAGPDQLAIDRIVVDAQHVRGRRGPRPHVTRRCRRRVRLIERGGKERCQLSVKRAIVCFRAQPRQRVVFGHVIIVLNLVETIGDSYDLRLERNVVARETVGIAGAVLPFVMPADHRHERAERFHRLQD